MRLRLWNEETGTASVLVLGLTLALLAVAGLVYDGGRILAARRQADHVADNAARAGAQAVDLDRLRAGGALRLADADAVAAADAYLTRVGHGGTVEVTAAGVEVTVDLHVNLPLLGLVGLEHRTVTGRGIAQIVAGVSGPDP